MNTVERLLKADAGKFVLPEKSIELKRLSNIAGGRIVFTIRAISHAQYEDIMDANNAAKLDIHGHQVSMQGIHDDSNCKVCLAGIVDPDLKNHELMTHYKTLTPEELLKKLLLPGEIATIAEEIMDLSGFNNSDMVQDVKN